MVSLSLLEVVENTVKLQVCRDVGEKGGRQVLNSFTKSLVWSAVNDIRLEFLLVGYGLEMNQS